MRVLLKLTLNCSPDAAWKAIRSPAVFRAVSAPLTTFTSLEDQGFPEVWPEGPHRVFGRAFGVVPMGEQVIDISLSEVSTSSTSGGGSATGGGPTRLVRDSGGGVTGPLAVITSWQHTMAVAPAAGGKTLFRDELKFEAGPVTVLLWPMFWAFWQWRSLAMRRLAPRWTV